MAHAKTSLPQIAAQLGIGVAGAAIFWHSFIRKTPATTTPITTSGSNQSVLAALDAETRQVTSGKVWQQNLQQQDHSKPTQDTH